MPNPVIAAAAFAVMLAACAATAQSPAPPPAGPGAMRGHGPGMGMGPGWRARNAHGWAMMTQAERQEHRARMRSFTTYGECHAYVLDHHRQMVSRAKERGVTIPAEPRRDPCAGLK